jgi:hypothetical protein
MNRGKRVFMKWFEAVLAILVLGGVFSFGLNGLMNFFTKDWADIATFYSFISFILLLLVGIELVRLILSQNITTVLELTILIVARKTLDPKIDAFGLLLSVISLGLLVGINYLYASKPLKSLEDLSE